MRNPISLIFQTKFLLLPNILIKSLGNTAAPKPNVTNASLQNNMGLRSAGMDYSRLFSQPPGQGQVQNAMNPTGGQLNAGGPQIRNWLMTHKRSSIVLLVKFIFRSEIAQFIPK
jgi:hypothetical protein